MRRAKSDAKLGMRAEVTSMTLVGPAADLDYVKSAEVDLRAAGKVSGMTYADGEAIEVRDAQLVPPPPRERSRKSNEGH